MSRRNGKRCARGAGATRAVGPLGKRFGYIGGCQVRSELGLLDRVGRTRDLAVNPASLRALAKRPSNHVGTMATTLFVFLLLPITSRFALSDTQNPLTNDDVIQMVKAGISPGLIARQIRSSSPNFDFSTPELIRLAKEGVPESLIEIMRNPYEADRSVPSTVAIKDGQRVPLVLAGGISTATVRVGDRVTFEVAGDIRIGDLVVIKKGAPAFGSISEARQRNVLGRGGRLSFEIQYVQAIDGQHLRLRTAPTRDSTEKAGKAELTLEAVSAPLALIVKGRHVVASKGTEYTAYVDEDKEVRLGTSLPGIQRER
jgi:hypothetical protein